MVRIAAKLGKEMGFEQEKTDLLELAGYFHDIGKLAVPEEMLSEEARRLSGINSAKLSMNFVPYLPGDCSVRGLLPSAFNKARKPICCNSGRMLLLKAALSNLL